MREEAKTTAGDEIDQLIQGAHGSNYLLRERVERSPQYWMEICYWGLGNRLLQRLLDATHSQMRARGELV